MGGHDVEVKDLGEREIMRLYRELGKTEINIGVLSSAGQDMVNIAVWNHFGTKRRGKRHTPERPFLALVFDEYHVQIKNKLAASVKNIQHRGHIHRELSKVGLFVEGLTKKVITLLDDPPNAPSTIKKKGADNPLIDSGRLRASVSYEIRKASR